MCGAGAAVAKMGRGVSAPQVGVDSVSAVPTSGSEAHAADGHSHKKTLAQLSEHIYGTARPMTQRNGAYPTPMFLLVLYYKGCFGRGGRSLLECHFVLRGDDIYKYT